MARNYPRKQTAFIFIICLILVFGTSVLVNGWPSTKKQVSFKNASEKTAITAIDIPDVSGESEWKKTFFEKDTNISVKGAKETKSTAPTEKLTPTDLFGRSFFTKYAELRRSGLSNNANAVDTISNQLISETLTGIKNPTTYSLKDIKTTYKSDIETTRKYAEGLMAILGDWMPEVNEVEIVTTALESGDMNELKKIDPIIAGYKTAKTRLLATVVPDTLALPHLDLINGISMQIFNAESLLNADKDPLTALAAVSLEVKSLETIAVAVGKLKNAFALAGITFVVSPSSSSSQSR